MTVLAWYISYYTDRALSPASTLVLRQLFEQDIPAGAWNVGADAAPRRAVVNKMPGGTIAESPMTISADAHAWYGGRREQRRRRNDLGDAITFDCAAGLRN